MELRVFAPRVRRRALHKKETKALGAIRGWPVPLMLYEGYFDMKYSTHGSNGNEKVFKHK